MEKFCILLLLAVIVNEAIGMNLRQKRQLPDEDENTLEERYGWGQERQWFPPSWPNRPTGPNRPTAPTRPTRPGQTTTQSPNGITTTTQSTAITNCLSSCPVTSEYNPVCGTNSMTYTNPGRLSCAQACGINVNLLRSSPCPTTTTTTAAPLT